jgi:capsular polysaccharide biosynthesis protein
MTYRLMPRSRVIDEKMDSSDVSVSSVSSDASVSTPHKKNDLMAVALIVSVAVAVAICLVLRYMILNKGKLQQFVEVVPSKLLGGKSKLKLKKQKFLLHLCLPVLLACLLVGYLLAHLSK